MVVLNILFYKLLQLNVYRPLYWAIIFISIIQLALLLPTAKILLRINYGCEIIASADTAIKTALFVFCLIFLILNFGYYSSKRTRRLRENFSKQSKKQIWLKTIFAILGCFAVLFFSDDFWSLFFIIPQC